MTEEARIIVISGLPGVGKSTVAHLVASRLGRAAHVEADRLHDMIVAGAVHPEASGPTGQAAQQVRLRLKNATALARSFVAAGFSAVIDDIISGRRFDDLMEDLDDTPFCFVMLLRDLDVMKDEWRSIGSPYVDSFGWLDEEIREQTPRRGLWIDTTGVSVDDTVNAVLAGLDDAVVNIDTN